MSKLLIYGAYGYTGRLLVDECLVNGIQPIIAGRNAEKTKKYAKEKGLEFSVFEINEQEKLEGWLNQGDVVVHCGGPFIHTAKPMVEACLKTNTHYLDITGEYQVFELVRTYDEEAKKKGLMLLPGAGFDVVPSDCLANHLKGKLPSATYLQLAFTGLGARPSRGTSKTMIENLGDPQMIRKDGQLVGVPMGSQVEEIDFGTFKQLTLGISWGDISTAFYSTGIPNIQVAMGTTAGQLSQLKKAKLFGFLLKLRFVKNYLQKQLDKKPDGPSDEKREKADMHLWGRATDGAKTVEARLVTPNGYTLTAKTSALIGEKVLAGDFKAGFQTPATAYGEGLILEVEGCRYE